MTTLQEAKELYATCALCGKRRPESMLVSYSTGDYCDDKGCADYGYKLDADGYDELVAEQEQNYRQICM